MASFTTDNKLLRTDQYLFANANQGQLQESCLKDHSSHFHLSRCLAIKTIWSGGLNLLNLQVTEFSIGKNAFRLVCKPPAILKSFIHGQIY